MNLKRTYLVFLRLLLLAMVLVAVSLANHARVIREDGVGPVKIGMTLIPLSAALHQELAADERDVQGGFHLKASGHDNVSFMIIDGHVARVEVAAPGVRTSTGIQVGESEAQVHRHRTLRDGRFSQCYGIRFETDKGKITMFYAGNYDAIQYVEGCE